MNFIEQMKQKAKVDKKRIVLPEALDLRIIQAASMALQEELCEIILIYRKGSTGGCISKTKSSRVAN